MPGQLQTLRLGVADLRKRLLPRQFSATGTYRNQVTVGIRTMSFVLLAHAEIETYFEERVAEIAKLAWQSWRQHQHISRTVLCLVGFGGSELPLPPDTLDPPGANQVRAWPARLDVEHRLSDAVSAFVRYVLKENHGINEKNMLRMLLPVGFPHGKCDQLLVAALNDFAIVRGLHAHARGTDAVRRQIDPKSEFDRVQSILTLLASIDAELDSLLVEATR